MSGLPLDRASGRGARGTQRRPGARRRAGHRQDGAARATAERRAEGMRVLRARGVESEAEIPFAGACGAAASRARARSSRSRRRRPLRSRARWRWARPGPATGSRSVPRRSACSRRSAEDGAAGRCWSTTLTGSTARAPRRFGSRPGAWSPTRSRWSSPVREGEPSLLDGSDSACPAGSRAGSFRRRRAPRGVRPVRRCCRSTDPNCRGQPAGAAGAGLRRTAVSPPLLPGVPVPDLHRHRICVPAPVRSASGADAAHARPRGRERHRRPGDPRAGRCDPRPGLR